MGHVVVKYKVTMDQPEEGRPDYDGIAMKIGELEEVQTYEIKPCVRNDVHRGSGSPRGRRGTVDEFEARVRRLIH